MTSDPALREALDEAADTHPYPIAAACAEVRGTEPRDDWHEWELLSRDVLTPVLTYLSHLLLSDLVATGREPARLFHRIESVLSRPLAGHYVGFLRETATYYRKEDVETAVPDLVDFLLKAEVDGTLTDSGRPLLGELVDFRNRWAHGRIENEDIVENSLRQIRTLTERLLSELGFLAEAPLTLEDGTQLMGRDPDLPDEPMPLVTVTAEGVSLRPLLLKLEGRELSVLAEADLRDRRLTYRSLNSYTQFDEDEDGEEATRLFEELKSLLQEVRSLEATLPKPDLETFRERAAVQTDRMLSLYGKSDLGKYDPDLYIPRPEWEGEDGRFWDFLASDETLLAIDGEQGTGKSALAARLAELSEERGHAVWFLNAQRFTFAEVSWSGNPFPRYFANRLSYEAPFDAEAIETLAEETEEDERIVLFVDGINEIGALSNKWNRFKAISQFLEWAEEVAHPKLKVVLTFRTEAYTRFDYLQSEDVPDEIEETSFRAASPTETDRTGEGTELPWVNRIDPFTEGQARQLYERLQKLDRGMAPDMTWDEIRKGLGDELDTFITNPLLFTIFLRAHDGESAVISTGQRELFTRYANGVTGARERQEWPWWKRAYHFLKNGNITDKERFLADCTEKASETGTPSFLLSDLEPESSDRDQRIAEFLADPEESGKVEELQEGGLLVQEPIYQTGEETTSDHRLSFTSELITQVMGKISESIGTWKRLRLSTIISIVLILVVTISFLFFSYAFQYRLTAAYQDAGGSGTAPMNQGIVSSMYANFFYTIPIITSIVIFYIYGSLPINTLSVRYDDIVLDSLKINIDKRLSNLIKNTGKIVFSLVIFQLLITLLLGGTGVLEIKYNIYILILLLIPFLMLPIPFLNGQIIIDDDLGLTRLQRNALIRIQEKISNYSIGNIVLVRRPHYLFFIYFVLFFAVYFGHNYIFLEPFEIMGLNDFISESLSYFVYSLMSFMQALSLDSSSYFFFLIIFFSTLVIIYFLIPYVDAIYNSYRYQQYQKHVYNKSYRPRFWYYSVSVYSLVVFIISIYVSNFSTTTGADSSNMHTPSSSPIVDKKDKSMSIRIPDGNSDLFDHETEFTITSVDFSETDSIYDSNFEILEPIQIDKITINSDLLSHISLSKWSHLRRLRIMGDSVQLNQDDAVQSVNTLEIIGKHVDGLSSVGNMYPMLATLSVQESAIPYPEGLPKLWKGALIYIKSEGPPMLTWLHTSASSYRFEFSHPPTGKSQNLSVLRHLSVPAEGLDPDVLREMTNLEWLYVRKSPCVKNTTSADERKWCQEMHEIDSKRSLNIEHFAEKETLFSKRAALLTAGLE